MVGRGLYKRAAAAIICPVTHPGSILIHVPCFQAEVAFKPRFGTLADVKATWPGYAVELYPPRPPLI